MIPILVIIFIRKFGNCRTLTAPVEFDKCISAINENAFVASEYPVIITLEDHLTSNLQKKAAEVCYKFFLSLSFSLGIPSLFFFSMKQLDSFYDHR